MFYTALAKPALSVAAIVAMGLVAAAAKDDRPQQSRVPSSGVSLVASADAGQATDPLVATEVEVEVTKRPSDDAGLEPAGLDADDQITGPTQPPTNVDVQPPSVPESPERPTTFPPKPAAPAAGSKQQSVQVEIATIDGSDEDILVFRGDQDAVKRIQGRMIKMFDKPPTPTAPPLLAAESRPRQVDPPDVDHDIRVPEFKVAAPAQPNFVWHQDGTDQPSVAELELELKYWETRTQGLSLKADGIEIQIERLQKLKDSGVVPAEEMAAATERAGDMTLLRADAFRAQAKVLEMKRKIERRKKALNVPTRISTPSYAVPPPQTNNTQPRYAADYSQPRYAPQPDPVYRDPNAPTPAQLTPRYGVHTTPAVPTPHLQWLSDFDEARKVSEQMGRRILVHNAMPYSQENARFREVIDGSPNIQLYVHQHYVPLRINPYTKSETLEQLRVDRVPPMGVFAADGRLLKELTLPQQPTELLLELRSVAEGDSSGQAIPNRTAKKPRYQRAEPAAPVDPEDMLLPHENVRVTITQQRPREGKWVITATVDSAGRIPLEDVGFAAANLGQVPIGGMDTNMAAKNVLSVLAHHYGKFFDSMGFDVKVERNRDMGEAKDAASGEESSSTSPPAPPATAAQELPLLPADAPPIDGGFELMPWEEDGSKKTDLFGWSRDFSKAVQQADQEDRMIVLQFLRPGNVSCLEYAKTLASDGEVRDYLAKHFVTVAVDPSKNTELAKQYHVEQVPSVVTFSVSDGIVFCNSQFVPRTDPKIFLGHLKSLISMRDGNGGLRATGGPSDTTPPTTPAGELVKLKKELEALRKENETLRKQTRDLPTLDPGPPSPAE